MRKNGIVWTGAVIGLIVCLALGGFPAGPASTGTAEAEGAVQANGAQDTNVVPNGGFEDTRVTSRNKWTNNVEPVGWSEWYASGSLKATVDSAVYREGSRSLRLESASGGRGAVSTQVSVIPGQTYRFGVWMKTDNVQSSAGGVFARTQFLDAAGKKVGNLMYTDKLTGTHDWVRKEMLIRVPGNAGQLKIEPFFETGTGSAWYDGVELAPYRGLTGLLLNRSYLALAAGGSESIRPIFIPSEAEDKTVIWSSSDPQVAEVDNGIVTGRKEGTTTITATTPDGRFTAECEVSVESSETFARFAELRQKWFQKLVGDGNADRADPHVKAYIDKLNESVQNAQGTGLWDTLNRAADRTYLWSDLASTTLSGEIPVGYGRLKTLALAYHTPGSIGYRNAELAADIVSALDWMYANRYNELSTEYGNWFHWEISGPQALNDVVVLMYDALSANQIQSYMRAVDRFVPTPYYRTINNTVETGANLLDKAMVTALRGIIGNIDAKAAEGRDAIVPVLAYVESGDGFYRDGSFVQHTQVAYTGGYGLSLVSRMADLLYMLQGSPWQVTDPRLNRAFDWVSDSFEPVIYKGAMMDMVRGREISRSAAEDHVVGRSAILSVLRMAEGAPPETALRIKRMAKEWIGSDTTYREYTEGLSLYDIRLVKALMADSSIVPRGELVKNQVFAGMDRIVHLRPGFGVGIGMFSDRISAFEYGNGENAKGWYTGIGAVTLYTNDLTQYGGGYWPTVDSFRLPGTTTDGSRGALKDWQFYRNPRSWVGGSSLNGTYGAAGMDFSLAETTGSSLQGKKSWFLFDDEIVALGAGITGSDDRKVETIVENRKLRDRGDNRLIVDGETKPDRPGWSETMSDVKWANLEGNAPGSDIGYVFPKGADIYGLRESRTGSWKEINAGGSAEPVANDFLSLAFDHGSRPHDATYSYILLPSKNAAETMAYSKHPDTIVLENSADVQAVKEKRLHLTAVNFWNPGTVEEIVSHQPASVLLEKNRGEWTLAVSDPTQSQSSIRLELNRPGLTVLSGDPAVQAVQSGQSLRVEIDTEGSLGRTFTVKLKDTLDDADRN
ncbi:polysaccharide lyase family 8 super-sandwich domain-containing protein [Paenibacillus sp. GYB003]|uniref:polysaccharide lyase family 8 super-sandwich domain-containing protein n=1 Tax=Paenibacillus sp. GYB003 TaxID=2994392 RepID=UPI002F96C098